MLFQHDVQGNFFDSNCAEMGVEAAEMDYEDGKLQNNIKLVSIEKSRDELLTSGKGNRIVEMMQRTVNENAARKRRICKRSDQSRIDRIANNDARLILREKLNGATT